MATKPRGGGALALVAGPLRKELVYGASLNNLHGGDLLLLAGYLDGGVVKEAHHPLQTPQHSSRAGATLKVP